MATSVLGTDDSINYAMLLGLKNAFRNELRSVLVKVAEKEIDAIIERISKRLKVNAKTWDNIATLDRHIKLEWIITHGGFPEDEK